MDIMEPMFCDEDRIDTTKEQITQSDTSPVSCNNEAEDNSQARGARVEISDMPGKGVATKPVSERKREANRRNAQQSSGPKTELGKSISRRNAIKHGILAKKTLIGLDGLPCDPQLDEYYTRLCTENPAEDLYTEFLRDDTLHAFAGYGKAIDLRNELDRKGRWAQINCGEPLVRYFGAHRKALLHNFKELRRLNAERREQEAEAMEENEQEVEVTGNPATAQNGPDNVSDLDEEPDDRDPDFEYQEDLDRRAEENPNLPLSYVLDRSITISRRDYFPSEETVPENFLESIVTNAGSESPTAEGGKQSVNSAAEQGSAAIPTHVPRELTLSDSTSADGLKPSRAADAVQCVNVVQEPCETADGETNRSLSAAEVVDYADLACLVASYASVLAEEETLTWVVGDSEPALLDTRPGSSTGVERQGSENCVPAAADGSGISTSAEGPAPPLPCEARDESQVSPEADGLQASRTSDLPAASTTVH